MSPGLEALPTKVLLEIVKKLKKSDLKQLSLVSKRYHQITLKPLWESVTITSESESELYHTNVARLPQRSLQFVRELRFDAEFYQRAISVRCPHNGPVSTNDPDKTPYFARLAQQADLALEKLRDSELQSFSWDLGTCVPPKILEPGGLVALRYPSLQSLHLITQTYCHRGPGTGWCDVDLSPFSQLQSLCWIAPNCAALNTLSSAIRRNSAGLQYLEVDFVCWETLVRYMERGDHQGIQPEAWSARFFGLGAQPPGIIFPDVRELSLTDVPLVAGLARAVNFGTLRSLTLRRCLGWADFLSRATELRLPIQLKTFEIVFVESTPHVLPRLVLGDFLRSFKGLEKFFIDEVHRKETLLLWDIVAHHQQTLKQFVHHQREEKNHRCFFGLFPVVRNLSLSEADLNRIQHYPLANPLHSLDLEFLGLSCHPTYLKRILWLFTGKKSLKVLHIRQPVPYRQPSSSGFHGGPSWALPDHLLDRRWGVWGNEMRTSPREVDDIISGRGDETDAALKFRQGMYSDFRDFAEWAFGPHGIRSLEFLVFGDYSFGGRKPDNRLIFCWSPSEQSHFRIIARSETDVAALDEYRAALRACPTHAFFDHHIGW